MKGADWNSQQICPARSALFVLEINERKTKYDWLYRQVASRLSCST